MNDYGYIEINGTWYTEQEDGTLIKVDESTKWRLINE